MGDALERARERRASLRSAMVDVESALAAPAPGREAAWRDDLAATLTALGEALERHITSTEADDGLLAEIMSNAPRLAHRIKRARADHERLRTDLTGASAAVAKGDDAAALRDVVLAVLAELVRHRQLGSDLVYEAYNVDIEGAD